MTFKMMIIAKITPEHFHWHTIFTLQRLLSQPASANEKIKKIRITKNVINKHIAISHIFYEQNAILRIFQK